MAALKSPSLLRTITLVLFCATILWTCDSATTNHEGEQEKQTPGGGGLASKKSLSVLLVSPPWAGHFIPLVALGEELARRGHNVTFSTTVMNGSNHSMKVAKRARINFLSAGQDYLNYKDYIDVCRELSLQTSSSTVIQRVTEVLIQLRYKLKRLLNSPLIQDFDIVVANEYVSATLACFHKEWNIPLIATYPSLSVSSELPPWPFPHVISKYTQHLSFQQRLVTAIEQPVARGFQKSLFDTTHCKGQKYHYAMNAPGTYIPHILTTVFGFEFPRPITPLTHYVGPMHTRHPEPLSLDLKTWLLGRSNNSVLYISMGSEVMMPQTTARALVEGILGTNYSAIWSLKTANQGVLEGLEIDPDRFFISSWLPQLSVLQHHAVSLAILHGGHGGLHEAFSAGIPVLVLPITNDQGANAVHVEYHGLGVQLDPRTISSREVTDSLITITSPKYRSAVRKIRRIHAEAGGVERAADLVEFYEEVGYEHLIPAYAKYEWSWVQYYSVDVYTTILCILLGCICLVSGVCFCMYRRIASFVHIRKAKRD